MKKVFVALSGGVDSSVAAALLQQQGYDVHGVFIEVWQPDWLPCTQDDDRKSALRVAAHLGIPFYTIDAREAYKTHVVDAMVSEYAAGRTPNPDVWCNRFVKFGTLWEWARAKGADYIATGHYAQHKKTTEGFQLLRGVDTAKDQSYFLWQLTQDDLAHTLFPVGHLPKPKVRELAEQFALPTATKKDSQGLCFMGQINIKEFLAHFMPQKKGFVVNTAGETVGEHDGALFYTIGQRHGFTLHTQSTQQQEMYVIAKDIHQNTLTVAHTLPTAAKNVVLENVNELLPIENGKHAAQIRYHGTVHTVRTEKQGDTLVVSDLAEQPARGQSVVLYDKDICVGGGVVQ